MAGSDLDEIRKSVDEIRDVVSGKTHPSSLKNPAEHEKVLELALDELRIIYNRLDSSLATVKIRLLTFSGAGLALFSYLYGGGDLFIPHEKYGKVFYFLGLGLSVSALSMLLNALRPGIWSVPVESKLHALTNFRTRTELLETIVDEYIESMDANIKRYEKKVPHLTAGFFQLLGGGILLLVIKSIGG